MAASTDPMEAYPGPFSVGEFSVAGKSSGWSTFESFTSGPEALRVSRLLAAAQRVLGPKGPVEKIGGKFGGFSERDPGLPLAAAGRFQPRDLSKDRLGGLLHPAARRTPCSTLGV